MSSYPNIPFTNIFNPNDFAEIDGSLSLADGDSRYFKISGGFVSGFSTFLNSLDVIGTLSINSIPINLSLIAGVTAGTPTPNKALSLDHLGKINGSINCTQLNTSSLLNITRSTNGRSFESVNGSSSCVLYHETNHDVWLGTSTNNNLILQTNNSPRLIINGLTGAISGISSLSTTSLIVNGITVSSADLAYLSSITPGTVTASKALVVDGNKDVSAFRNVFATKFCNNASYSSFPIDMGASASDRLLAVFENGAAFYGLGANASRLQLHSASGGGIRMYTGSSVGATGTQIFDINSAGLITADSITLDTALSVPIANIRDNSQTHDTRIEYLSLGRSSSGSDHGAWSFMNYYSSSTQGDSNYITFSPRLRTGLTTGWGMCMTQNGNFSFQNKDSNGGAGGFKIQASILGTVDIMGGNIHTIGAGHGYLQPDSGSPADYNAGTVSTRIGLWVENSIWCQDKLYSSSDYRLKRNIKSIPLDEAKKLLNVRAVSYQWKKDTEDHMHEIGCIAQELLEAGLAPLVSFCPNNDKENFPEGYQLGLQYSRLPIYMIELIKDLYKQIDELKKN